ncbi:MAG: MBL fold metallo-hydrolase [Actinobacteria bacterium]|nr:MBL fold metallo-hydrolase [Actinomycetota bacterium]
MAAQVKIMKLGPIQTNCYLVSDEKGCMVVDPADNAPAILAELDGRKLDLIVLTHRHWDHLQGAADLMAASGAPIAIGEFDADAACTPGATGGQSWGVSTSVPRVDRRLEDGEIVEVGAMRFTVLNTPGHTVGSICLYEPTEKILLSGDTLFAAGVGRTDLETGSKHALVESIKTKLAPLPDDVTVYPGHEATSTVGAERSCNSMMRRP